MMTKLLSPKSAKWAQLVFENNDQELKTDVVSILLLFHEPADEGLIMTKKSRMVICAS